MATLKGELRSFFERLPEGEISLHNQVLTPLSLIVCKHAENPDQAVELIHKMLAGSNHRAEQPNEIKKLVLSGYDYLANPNRSTVKKKREAVDAALQKTYVGDEKTYEEFMLASDPIPHSGSEAIGGLFEDDDAIFIQPELHSKPLEFCRPVREWKTVDLKPYQYMTHNPSVPNPTGRNESNLSGQRKYLLHEVDDKAITFEQQLGLIKQLETIVPLKMVVSSGGRVSTHGFIGNPVEGMTFSRFPRNSGETPDSQTGLSFADSRGVRGEKRANHWPPSNRSSIGRMIDLVIRAKAVRRFLRLGIPTIQALQTADKLMQGRKVYALRDKDTLKPNLVLTIGRNHIK